MENSSLKLAHVLINTDIERLHHGYFFRYACNFNPSMNTEVSFPFATSTHPFGFYNWAKKMIP